MFRALVEHAGFTGIAMETGYAESLAVEQFTAEGTGHAADTALRFLTSGFGNFQANVELLEWIRAYNRANAARTRLRFFGIDLSLGGPVGSSATAAPIECALSRLQRKAPSDAQQLRRTFTSRVQPLWLAGPLGISEFNAYDTFVITLLKAAQPSGDAEASHCAAVAAQAGRVQRLSPPPRPGGGIPPDAWRTLEARDMAMADNVSWAREQLGAAGKLLVFAHNAHAINAPQRGGHLRGLAQPPRSMGQRLREQLGERFVIVAEAAPAGTSRGNVSEELGDVLRGVAPAPFLLDLRAAPPNVRSWLNRPIPLRADRDSETTVSPAAAFDAVIVQATQSAARPNPRGLPNQQ